MRSGGGGRRGRDRGAEGAKVRPGTPKTVPAALLLQLLPGCTGHARGQALECWTASFWNTCDSHRSPMHAISGTVSERVHVPGPGRRLYGHQGTRRRQGTEGRGPREPRRQGPRSRRRRSPRQAAPRCSCCTRQTLVFKPCPAAHRGADAGRICL